MKKKRKYNLKVRIIQQLRKIFFYSPLRREAMDRAKVVRKNGTTRYRCAKTKKLFAINEVTVDHKEPVVNPEEGFKDWNTFIDRLFCDPDNLQVLSKQEHKKKTAKERLTRKGK